ncbi:MAG: hypothetical protein ACC655_07515 [Rhodothermia bacterium]
MSCGRDVVARTYLGAKVYDYSSFELSCRCSEAYPDSIVDTALSTEPRLVDNQASMAITIDAQGTQFSGVATAQPSTTFGRFARSFAAESERQIAVGPDHRATVKPFNPYSPLDP